MTLAVRFVSHSFLYGRNRRKKWFSGQMPIMAAVRDAQGIHNSLGRPKHRFDDGWILPSKSEQTISSIAISLVQRVRRGVGLQVNSTVASFPIVSPRQNWGSICEINS